MELTREKIREYKEHIPGLDGYYIIVSEIEDNLLKNPDISIESCKSLIEGLCKKALELISDKYNSDKGLRGTCEDNMKFLMNLAFDEVYASGVERNLHESLYKIIKNKVRTQKLLDASKKDLLKNSRDAISKITAIRHNRGDISHGRIYPKKQESEVHLANSIKSITDGICSYMIHEFSLQYIEKEELLKKLLYLEQLDYNDWLDSQNDKLITKIDFSRLLYENNYEKYEEIYYSEYMEHLEMTSTEVENEVDEFVDKLIDDKVDSLVEEALIKSKGEDLTEEVIKDIVGGLVDDLEEAVENIEELTNTFDEKTFWTFKRETMLRIFSKRHSLVIEKTRELIEGYLFTEKEPILSDVINVMIKKPKLIERRKVGNSLRKSLVNLVERLNNLE